MESLFLLLLPFFSPLLLIIVCSKNTCREPIKSKELIPQREANTKLAQSGSSKTTSESLPQPSTSDDVNLKDESIKISKLFDGECTVAGSMQRAKQQRTRETQSMTGEEDMKDRSRRDKKRNNEDGSRKERRRKKSKNDDRSERSERATYSEKTLRSHRETDDERSTIAT